MKADGVVDEDAVCDCAVDDLLELLLSEIDEMAHDDKNHIKHLHKNLLNNMPRHVNVQQQGDLTDLRISIQLQTVQFPSSPLQMTVAAFKVRGMFVLEHIARG